LNKYNCQDNRFQDFTIENEFYLSLPEGHVIRTLMEEHQVILKFCIALEELTKDLLKINSLDKAQEIIANMQYISGHLLRTERHHIREEHTFIRRLVSFAEFEPSLEIRRQHDKLGVQKRTLERTIYSVYTTPFEDFKKDIKKASYKLVQSLKNHVDIEDNVLYPQAVKLITDDERWNKMKEEADNIGYCCFTPNKS